MNKFMFLAIEEAKKGIKNNEGGPFGAVIVKDGVVVGKGHNRVVLNNDCTCHGEIEAIRDASKNLGTFDLSGCEIYTTGYPCPMCMGAILWSNMKKFYYGCNVKDTNDIGFRDEIFYNRTEEEKRNFEEEVDRKECLDLYKEYSKLTNKTNY